MLLYVRFIEGVIVKAITIIVIARVVCGGVIAYAIILWGFFYESYVEIAREITGYHFIDKKLLRQRYFTCDNCRCYCVCYITCSVNCTC